ncbi:MAG: zinc ribbon domain-containing protein [Acidobacteria bacterium]|nr:zinc ribbon domain-containing protein [Acidobacteriota bacterium]
MFCSTCGKAVNEKLNYCNNCGAKLGGNVVQAANAGSPPILSVAAAFFGAAGLFGFVVILKILLESRLDQPSVLLVLVAYLVTLFLLCTLFMGHLWKRSGGVRARTENAPEDYAPPKTFRAGSTNQLEPPRESFIGSVTEETTRTLDRV